MTPTQDHQPPSPDEIEVSLFGPGVGEAILVHVGDGEWIVVDSCIDTRTKNPVALDYLNFIGVNLSAVKRIIVTHWHDDHIQGIARVLEFTPAAQIVFSAALTTFDFARLVAMSNKTVMQSSGVSEFREIFSILRARAPKDARFHSVGPTHAKENFLVFERMTGVCPVRVWALSPSEGTLNLSFFEFVMNSPQVGQQVRRVVALSPNQIAVVLWINIGEINLLLGSDLEESNSSNTGWRAIVASCNDARGLASVFKVPHHGSKNADNDDVWKKMLVSQPMAVLTPFSAGKMFLPTDEDFTRLLLRTPHVYCTSKPGGAKPQRRASTVEKMINQVASRRRALRGRMGHVRVRSHFSRWEPQIHCCNGAYLVTQDSSTPPRRPG